MCHCEQQRFIRKSVFFFFNSIDFRTLLKSPLKMKKNANNLRDKTFPSLQQSLKQCYIHVAYIIEVEHVGLVTMCVPLCADVPTKHHHGIVCPTIHFHLYTV